VWAAEVADDVAEPVVEVVAVAAVWEVLDSLVAVLVEELEVVEEDPEDVPVAD
jgi:hypothetical protein